MRPMMKAALAICMLTATASQAQTRRCLPRDTLVQTLERKYAESRIGIGVQSAQQIIEVWGSEKGNFTVFVTRADGLSCIVATGEGWHNAVTDSDGKPEGDNL